MEERNLYLEYNLQWFAKDGPGGEKTEPATAKKLKDAREEGKVAKSKELNSAADLIAATLFSSAVILIVNSSIEDIISLIFIACSFPRPRRRT